MKTNSYFFCCLETLILLNSFNWLNNKMEIKNMDTFTLYSDDRIAILRYANGDIRIDRRNMHFGTSDPDGTIDSVTIPNAVARFINFDNL